MKTLLVAHPHLLAGLLSLVARKVISRKTAQELYIVWRRNEFYGKGVEIEVK